MPLLNARTLAAHAARVPVPTYDRSRVRTGIVHFGVGGFHRAHQAVYLDELMRRGLAADWGVCGVGLLPGDRRMQRVLEAQDHLYTVVVKHADGTREPRVVGSVVEYLFAPDDPEAVVEKLADGNTRIVSLTITEGGYNVDDATGRFDADDPAVRADLAPGAVPTTVFGLVVEALARRRARGVPPFTVMSCDNLPGNGDVARRCFTAFADLRDPELGEWVRREVRFPDSMVDRITPVTTDEDRAELARDHGVEDGWPVVCEPFSQWVLEDSFTLGRPPLEEVGVRLVEDVAPYELVKLRLLNAGHQVIGHLGVLAGHRFAHEVCRDPLFAALLLRYTGREAVPTLPPAPGVDLDRYQDRLLERFGNAEVADTLARLCADTSDRIPKFLLPVVRENLAAGGEVGVAALVVAGWTRYAEGVDDRGEPIEVVDRLREPLVAAARRHDDPTAFLGLRDVFGDLVDEPRFVAAYTTALAALRDRGARAAVAELVGRSGDVPAAFAAHSSR
ncbi:mannitol dehydrogenase family protein [Saccharothrix longispora]|uniref:mannitol dehydrogenase family protein n=1 Tax=Saccharothrix longispora TaxID=33920 RepID=UPI0028FD0C42|nr:mannitol dehydrogenase family protein [Saccharothrix longispora]MDU0289440.1 mannitol dehydrogenase family protein [Saccharothrix longispora]